MERARRELATGRRTHNEYKKSQIDRGGIDNQVPGSPTTVRAASDG